MYKPVIHNKLILLQYSLMAIPLAMLGLPVYIYLPSYYAAEFAMSLSAIGTALLAARLLDVLTDPMIGYWSDRFNPSIPRKLQISFATLVLMGLLVALFLPQLFFHADQIGWVMLFSLSFLSYLAWTLIQVPYLALAAEVKQTPRNSHTNSKQQNQPNQQNRQNHQNPLVSSREAMTILGVLLMLVLPILLAQEVTEVNFYMQFLSILAVIFCLALLALWQLNIRTVQPVTENKTSNSPLEQWRQLKAKHPNALLIFLPYFLNNLANAIPATLFLIFVEQYLQLKQEAGIFLLIYFLAGLISLPFWLKLASHFGSVRIWRFSILLSVISFSLVFALQSGDKNLYLLICILTGLSLTIDIAIPASIQTHISQQIEKQSDNMHGFLFGIWGMTTKLSLAAAVGLSLPLLDGLTALGLSEQSSLLWLYALPAMVLKLWVWWHLKNIQPKLEQSVTS